MVHWSIYIRLVPKKESTKGGVRAKSSNIESEVLQTRWKGQIRLYLPDLQVLYIYIYMPIYNIIYIQCIYIYIYMRVYVYIYTICTILSFRTILMDTLCLYNNTTKHRYGPLHRDTPRSNSQHQDPVHGPGSAFPGPQARVPERGT